MQSFCDTRLVKGKLAHKQVHESRNPCCRFKEMICSSSPGTVQPGSIALWPWGHITQGSLGFPSSRVRPELIFGGGVQIRWTSTWEAPRAAGAPGGWAPERSALNCVVKRVAWGTAARWHLALGIHARRDVRFPNEDYYYLPCRWHRPWCLGFSNKWLGKCSSLFFHLSFVELLKLWKKTLLVLFISVGFYLWVNQLSEAELY